MGALSLKLPHELLCRSDRCPAAPSSKIRRSAAIASARIVRAQPFRVRTPRAARPRALNFRMWMMAREPKIAYVLLRNAHFGPRLAASVELCVRDLIRSQPICALDPGRLPAGGRAVRGHRDRDDSRRADQRQSRKGLGRRPASEAPRRRSRHCRKSPAGGGVHRADLGRAGDFAHPRLCQSAVERA